MRIKSSAIWPEKPVRINVNFYFHLHFISWFCLQLTIKDICFGVLLGTMWLHEMGSQLKLLVNVTKGSVSWQYPKIHAHLKYQITCKV